MEKGIIVIRIDVSAHYEFLPLTNNN